MKLAHRFIPTEYEYHEKILEEIMKHPGCCDTVWLTTCMGYPSKEEHKRVAAELTRVAELYRKNGIEVSLQLANSIGHGIYMCAWDCSGLVYEGSPAEPIVGPDGLETNLSFCPRGKNFREYIIETASYYATIRPDCFWIDDDFRLLNHKPVNYGCFCDECIAKFNERYGAEFTREALVNEILHGDKTWRERFLLFQRQGMEELMTGIMEAFIKLSPESTGGLQHASPGAYIMGDHRYGFDPIYKITGKGPKSRPGGGTYNDHTPHRIIEKGIDICLQNMALPEYVEEIYPEVENIPHFSYGKTPNGAAIEISYYFSVGATDMSLCYSNGPESMEFYGEFMEKYASHRAYWSRLSMINRKSRPAGLNYFVSKDAYMKDISENGGFDELNGTRHAAADLLFRDAIPICYDRRADSVYLLYPEEARTLSDNDIKYLLQKGVITDCETIDLLRERKIDLGIEVYKFEEIEALRLSEVYTNHPVNGGEAGFEHSFFSKGNRDCYYIEDKKGDAEILAYYNSRVPLRSVSDDKEHPWGIAEMIVTTPEGGKWCIVGYQAWKANITKARRDRFLEIADYIGSVPICAKVITRHQAIIHPRVDNEGHTLSVSIVNCTIGKCEGVELLIRDPKSVSFEFVSQYTPPIKLEARKEDDGYVVKIPQLDAWTMGTVFCD